MPTPAPPYVAGGLDLGGIDAGVPLAEVTSIGALALPGGVPGGVLGWCACAGGAHPAATAGGCSEGCTTRVVVVNPFFSFANV